jgi:FkbM family methyltransferase
MMYLLKDRFIGRSFNEYGESHEHEIRFLRELLFPGDLFVDVGANIGTLTVPLAQAVGKDGHVIAMEAQRHVYHVLCGNLALNQLHNVTALNRAVAEKSNSVAFLPEVDYDTESNYGGVQVTSEYNMIDAERRKMTIPVSTIAIDDLQLKKPRLIKIDVEGMEPYVLAGAIQTIDNDRPMLYIEFMTERERILNFLKDHGYMYRLVEAPLFNANNHLNKTYDIFEYEGYSDLVSCDLFCWHESQPPPYFPNGHYVDLEGSCLDRHKLIKELVSKVYGTRSS